jgi:glycolate oxidase iron-sulfur subunit
VQYGRLLDTGREWAERTIHRPLRQRLERWLVRAVVPHPARFALLLRLGRLVRSLLPRDLKARIPAHRRAAAWPEARHTRRMLVLEGCVQPALAPGINAAAARVLDRLGISLIAAPGGRCCGAVSHHTSGAGDGLAFARRNIDAWWPQVEQGVEAIVMTASGCGVHVKDYGHLLRDDPVYAARGRRVSELTRDLSEVLAREDLARLKPAAPRGVRVAFQSPCTLQHGQRLNGVVEDMLRDLGFDLASVPDAHLCCGSAGTWSLLQGALARQLRDRKLAALEGGKPEVIATANVGCLAHLQAGTLVPVRHWVELLAD